VPTDSRFLCTKFKICDG